MILLALYVLCIPAANWAITTYGVVPIGPFGLMAPAGVLFAGLAFTLRDLCQESLGKALTLAAIGAGALLSLAVSDPFVAAASATAFLVSELCDFAIYTPLRERGMVRAVVVSNLAGMAVDSALFLYVAGFPMALLVGLMVGKLYTIAPAVAFVWWLRSRRQTVVAVA
jgi:queuosine precursor transporter